MRYAVRRVSPVGALFYGLVLGMAVWLIPGVLSGWLARSLILGLKDWLSGLTLAIPLPFGEGLTLDLTAAMPVAGLLERLTILSGQGILLFFAIALGIIAAGMLLTGLSAVLGALLYNLFAGLFGGLEVRVDDLEPAVEIAPPGQASRSPAAQPARPPVKAPTATDASAAAQPRRESASPGRTSPAAWLALTSNPNERYLLRNEVTRVGSAPDNDIVLPALAAHHAEIRRENVHYVIYDLGTHRTWVDEAQVAAIHPLKNNARLQLGQSEFIVHIAAALTAFDGGRSS